MSALHCELKSWWIYKVAVRSFPNSYKSLALSKYTVPNDFTTTIHPLQRCLLELFSSVTIAEALEVL